MAIDSEAKRKSVPRWITGVPGIETVIIPDGAFSATDRQTLTAVYGGIAAGAPPAITGGARKHTSLLLHVYNPAMGAAGGGGAAGNFVLTEDGNYLLTEDGDRIILE